MPLKHIKYFAKKNTSHIVKHKNMKSKIKPIKTGKELGTTYCLGCKDFTNNFRPQEVKMTNKVLKEKSNYVVCHSSESRFLKQQRNTRK